MTDKSLKVASTELRVEGPTELIRDAIAKGANLEQLEKLLELRERYEAGEAKKAYHSAMAEFKANPPSIDKDKKVSFNQTKYNYASLANVTKKISAELSKYGLSASWSTKQNGVISVTCRITHVKGHGEETTISADADLSGSKNKIQAIGSTITYLERYTLLALTGLAADDQDDDAQAASVEMIDDKQLNQLRDMLIDKDIKEGKLCSYLKIDNLPNLPKSKFQQAKIAIEGAKKKVSK